MSFLAFEHRGDSGCQDLVYLKRARRARLACFSRWHGFSGIGQPGDGQVRGNLAGIDGNVDWGGSIIN